MGDRANVRIHEDNQNPIYLYSHWHGSDLPQLVWDVMQSERAKNRADDAMYLARIIFEYMLVTTDSIGEEAGWGIASYPPDGADRIVDINCTIHGALINFKGYSEEDFNF